MSRCGGVLESQCGNFSETQVGRDCVVGGLRDSSLHTNRPAGRVRQQILRQRGPAEYGEVV